MMNALRGKRRRHLHTPDSGISALHNLVTTDTPVSPVEMLNVKKDTVGQVRVAVYITAHCNMPNFLINI